MSEKCAIARCRSVYSYIYYDKNVCEEHWQKHCGGKFDLKKELKIGKKTEVLNNED